MKTVMPRHFYYPRAVDVDVEHIEAADGSEIVTYTNPRGPAAMVFSPKASKPDWHYNFINTEQRAAKIAAWQEGRRLHVEAKEKMKAERAKPHNLKVGDILCSSWGYDQTNIDFYEVIRVVSSVSVEIRRIAAESTPETGFMTAYKTPVPGQYVGKPKIKRASASHGVRINSFAWAFPWDGKPERYSWYA